MRLASLLLIAAASACTGSGAPATPSQAPAAVDWRLSTELAAELKAASCPADATPLDPEMIDLAITPVQLRAPADALAKGVRYAGGWALESGDPRFGGLSGLAHGGERTLLAVSDGGAFVWLDYDESGAPAPAARLAEMLDAAGEPFGPKRESDAEGLAVREGLAFVSFERDHRVLAYDLSSCGAAARGAAVFSLPASLARDIGSNRGAEGVALTDGGALLLGLETLVGDAAPILDIGDSAQTSLASARLMEGGGLPLTGLDIVGDQIFSLHRSYSPATGNLIAIARASHAAGADRFEGVPIIRLARPATVDNFEGVAARRKDDGSYRLFVISDDNFSDRQRTLLMAFDVPAP